MKIKLLVISLLLMTALSIAQHPSSDAKQLTGSEIKLEELIEKADLVVVATPVEIGRGKLGTVGSIYRGFRINVTRILKGQISSDATVTLPVRNDQIKESPPSIGKSYIFIMQTSHQQYIVRKVTPFSEDVISNVLTQLSPGK